MKEVRKILPISLYDIPGMENWLEEQANNGLFPVSIGSWATFTTDGVAGTRFRLEPYGKSGNEPTEEQLALYRNAGWEYALTIGSAYFLFYTTDPAAIELYSDFESRGLSLERLEKAVRSAQRRRSIVYSLLAAVLVWTMFFFKSKYDVQPDAFAHFPLTLIRLFNPTFLVFLVGQIFIWRQDGRNAKMLRKSCQALKNGEAPPPSPGPNKRIVRENIASIVLIIPLLILLLGQWFDGISPYENIPLDDFDRPYVAIQDIEDTPVYQWNDVFKEPPFSNELGFYSANVELSLLAASWYSVTQDAVSPQNGTKGNVFSKDPENGANRYAPELDTTCFKLLIPALARPVAEAQMDSYRLINLRWRYAEIPHPELDFVIIADEPEGIWQMAALGKDGRVAVFRYGGQEDLRDHLELLSTLVK